jgi:hypothetical protein
MACGGNDITHGDLATGPTSAADVAQAAAAFLAEKRSGRSIAPRSEKFGGPDGQMYYSAAAGTLERADRIEYYVGPDGEHTYMPDRHVHVTHRDKDPKHEVVIVTITDRTYRGNFHPYEDIILHNPSGREVNKAIEKAVELMNSRPIGPREVTY